MDAYKGRLLMQKPRTSSGRDSWWVLWVGCLLLLLTGCGTGSRGTSGGDGGSPEQADATDAKNDLGLGTGPDREPDLTTADRPPLDYFIGKCGWPEQFGPVPVDAGLLPHGLTVLATGLPSALALETDGTNVYFATSTGISRMELAGGQAVEMILHAAPVAMAIDADNLYWSDASVSGQTTVLSAPLSATGLEGFDGDGRAGQGVTELASAPGSPGAFTLAEGNLYFAAGSTVVRVASAGGSVETVITGIAPTGMAVATDRIYLGNDPDEVIDVVGLSGSSAGKIIAYLYANATPSGVTLSGGDLYWGDWFGTIEHVTVAKTSTENPLSTGSCESAACKFQLRATTDPDAAWAVVGNDCGRVGIVSPDKATIFAKGLSRIGGIAVANNHLYAMTGSGELLRWDL
jgi:hypothetical protein